MCKALREKFGEATLFLRFPWSGLNRVSFRADASRSLRQLLDELNEGFEGSKIFLIGHSHGGAVI